MKKFMFNDRLGLTRKVIEGTKGSTCRGNLDGYVRIDPEYNENGLPTGSFFGRRAGDSGLHRVTPAFSLGEVLAVAMSYQEAEEVTGIPFDDSFRKSGGYRNKMFVRAELMPYTLRVTDIKAKRISKFSLEEILTEGVERVRSPYNGSVYKDYSDPSSSVGLLSFRSSFNTLLDSVGMGHLHQKDMFVFLYSFELNKI